MCVCAREWVLVCACVRVWSKAASRPSAPAAVRTPTPFKLPSPKPVQPHGTMAPLAAATGPSKGAHPCTHASHPHARTPRAPLPALNMFSPRGPCGLAPGRSWLQPLGPACSRQTGRSAAAGCGSGAAAPWTAHAWGRGRAGGGEVVVAAFWQGWQLLGLRTHGVGTRSVSGLVGSRNMRENSMDLLQAAQQLAGLGPQPCMHLLIPLIL